MTDDLKLLNELGRTPLPTAAELTPARAQLMAAMNSAGAGAGAGRRAAPWWRRPLVTAGLATGLAAAVAVAVMLAPGSSGPDQQGALPGPSDGTGSTGSTSGAGPTSGTGSAVAPASPTVAEVLRRAAVAAIAQPFVEPRADQFVYREMLVPEGTRRDWFSVDGTRDSLLAVTAGDPGIVEPGCVGGQRTVQLQGGGRGTAVEPCEARPAYLPDVPTDATAMLAYLEAMGGHPGVNSMAKNILSLASDSYLRPEARAAVFEAAGQIPGIEIVPDVVDGAGRPGVGVGWTYGTRIVMVFDPGTYAFLGFEGGEAMVNLTIVDAVGQLP